MSLSNKIPLSIVNLNTDCLFQILSHLKLSDILNFRLQCSTLNDAVCKFLPHLAKLSIIYTEYPIEFKQEIKPVEGMIYQACKHFTSRHFRKKDFILISGRQNYEKFIEFLKMYEIRNIKKLAMIIDPKPSIVSNLWAAFELLAFCSKVETLLLERFGRWKEYETTMASFRTEDLKRLFNTIIGFSSLSELHFFPCPQLAGTRLLPTDYVPWTISQVEAHELIGNFFLTMFQKLRIFSINYSIGYPRPVPKFLVPLFERNFDTLELGFYSEDCLAMINSGTKFKKIHTLTLFGVHADMHFEKFDIRNSFDQLTTLKFRENLELSKDLMLKLNCLPNLENLFALRMRIGRESFEADGTVGDLYLNHSIKHIQVEELDSDFNELHPFTLFFPNLLSVTVFEPEVHNTVYEGQALNDLRMLGYDLL